MSHKISTVLMDWYTAHYRHLPWRETADPYRIWLSEIILQQTRVAQGESYYCRFTERFPTVADLAAAPLDEVLKLWQGLGYYSRARNLHAAAQQIAERGAFPESYDEVLRLKGVGRYTAAAICSFAFNQPHAVVDGNVYRLLARYFAIHVAIDTREGEKLFASLASEVMDEEHPALHNQAMMEFGALHCTPTAPQCSACPLAESCGALAEGSVGELPRKNHRTKVTTRHFNYLFVHACDYTYIYKRGAGDIWQHLYELPLIETEAPLTLESLLAHPTFASLIAPDEVPQVRTVRVGMKHVLTHRVILANLFEVTLPEETRSFSSYLRVKISDLEQYAVPRLVERCLESLTL